MRLRNWTMNLFVATVFVCAPAAVLLAQTPSPWPPIPDEDLAMKDNPAKPGSSAMILIKRESRDDVKRTWETFYRIKIFTENGREYGDIQIPCDGRAAEFKGPIYEKTLARIRKSRVMAKTFTLPDVRAGSIIDYRYVMKSKLDSPLSEPWVVQEKLSIRRAEVGWRPQTERIVWRHPACTVRW